MSIGMNVGSGINSIRHFRAYCNGQCTQDIYASNVLDADRKLRDMLKNDNKLPSDIMWNIREVNDDTENVKKFCICMIK